jgi:hypothetical protein
MPNTEPNARADRDVTSSSHSARPKPSRWVAPVALAIAVIATGLAIWALVRSPGEPAVNAQPSADAQSSADAQHSADPQQSDAAKTRTCAAFDMVRKAVSMQTNIDLGPDPVAKEAVAANARLATLGGGDFLLSRLDPGTPTELADAVRSFANNLQDIGMSQLVGVPNSDPALAATLGEAQAASERITGLCR